MNEGSIVFSGDTPMLTISPEKTSFFADKKNRLIVIVCLIAVFLTLSVTIFLFLRRSVSTPDRSRNSIFSSFNLYANYLLNGEESTNEIPDFTVSDRFYVDDHYTEPEYLDRLGSLYASFIATIDPELNLHFSSIDDTVEFLKSDKTESPIDDSALTSAFLSGGTDGANAYLDSVYPETETDAEEENYHFSTFRALDRARAEAMIAEWEFFASSGCLVDGSFDQNCINNLLGTATLNDLSVRLGEADASYSGYPHTLVLSLKRSLKNINEILNNLKGNADA